MDEQAIRELLEQVKDPEIPALSVLDMGIVREIEFGNGGVTVKITPTYSGCPAMKMITDDIVSVLSLAGISEPKVEQVLHPPWTTDWLTDKGRQHLKESGIAPPCTKPDEELVAFPKLPSVACPFCDSKNTERKSEFGSTACKALYFCNACHQPFDYFKAL